MDTTVKQLNIKVVTEGLDDSIAKVNQLGDTIHNLSSKQTTKSIKAIANSSKSKKDKSSTNDAKQTSKILKSSASSLSSILIKLISIRKLSNFFKDAFEESSAWIENLNLFEVAMKDNTKAGLEFTKTMSNAFGLDQNQLIEYMGLFNQMATAIGNATDIAYKMSEALTALGLDISSLYNISVESAMSKLRSGIAGQVKPVRELGLDITAQSLDAYIQDVLGLNMTSKMLSQSQKQLLRTIMLIRQTNNAWGDLSKTINTFSNQQKVLSAQITQLKRAFGDFFIGTVEEAGVATKALYYINGVLMALVEIVRTILPERTSSGFEQVNNSISETTDYLGDLEDSVEGSLLSFDKFNSLNSQDNKGQDWITKLLEQGFLQEYEAYMNRFNESMNSINNKAIEIKNNILDWLGYTKEINPETGETSYKLKDAYTNLEKIRDILIAIVAINVANKLSAGLTVLIASLTSATTATTGLAIAQNVLLYSSMFVLVKLIIEIVKNWDNMTSSQRATIVVVTTLVGTFTALQIVIKALTIKQLATAILSLKMAFSLFLPVLLKTILALSSLSVLALGVYMTINNWSQMSSWEKVRTILAGIAAAAIAAAVAIGAFHTTWTMGLGAAAIAGGIALLVSSMASVKADSVPKYANGGFPETGQLFIANEAGPEFIGNMGGHTAVANNDQIVQGITQGVYSAMMAYNSQTRGQGGTGDVYLDGNKVGKVIAKGSHKEMVRAGLILASS